MILHWNKAYDKYPFLNEDIEQCPNDLWKKCHVITDTQKASEADVITIYGTHMGMLGMKRYFNRFIKMRQDSDAIFLFHSREPPTITGSFGNWSYNFFDMTMTYRSPNINSPIKHSVEISRFWYQSDFTRKQFCG